MRSTKLRRISILLILVLLLCTFFVACNKEEELESPNTTRSLYVLGFNYYPEEDYMVAYVGFAGKEEKKLPITATWETSKHDEGFYSVTESKITLTPDSIFSAVNGTLTQDEKIYDGKEYSSLKVQLRYDTIYKIIKSEGNVKKVNKTYIHTFDLDESQSNFNTTLVLTQPKQSAWYGTLAGCAGAVLIIIIVVSQIWRKKNGRKEVGSEENREGNAEQS